MAISLLPSKKIIWVVVFGIVILGGAAFMVFGGKKAVVYNSDSSKLAAVENDEAIQSLRKDSDGDGLKDWEEALWKTDPNNSDTDGDGTPDGVEIKEGRDPTVPGPKDKLQAGKTGALGGIQTEEKLTETDKFARDLFSRYFDAKRTGQLIDAETEQQIITAVLSGEDFGEKARQYSEAELKIISDSGPAALRNYANSMGEIILKHQLKSESEIAILNRAVQKQSPEELKKLEPIIKTYNAIVKDMLAVSVPKDVLPLHLGVLNSVSTLAQVITDFGKTYEDPILAIKAIAAYTKSVTNMVSAFKAVTLFFLERGIVFSPGENGYAYLNLFR